MVLNPDDPQSKHILTGDGISEPLCAGEKRWGALPPNVLIDLVVESGGAFEWYKDSVKVSNALKRVDYKMGQIVAYGMDGYNSQITGDISSTIGVNCGMSTGRNGVVIGLDVFNQQMTGNVSKTLNNRATDSDHVPCVVFVKKRNAQSIDDYETRDRDAVSRTLNEFDNNSEARATAIVVNNSGQQ